MSALTERVDVQVIGGRDDNIGPVHRLAFIGSSGCVFCWSDLFSDRRDSCGKTSFVQRLTTDKFTDIASDEADNVWAQLTAATGSLPTALAEVSVRSEHDHDMMARASEAHVLFLCCDVSDVAALVRFADWAQSSRWQKIVLLVLKTDLRSELPETQVLSHEAARTFARDRRMSLLTASAKTGDGMAIARVLIHKMLCGLEGHIVAPPPPTVGLVGFLRGLLFAAAESDTRAQDAVIADAFLEQFKRPNKKKNL